MDGGAAELAGDGEVRAFVHFDQRTIQEADDDSRPAPGADFFIRGKLAAGDHGQAAAVGDLVEDAVDGVHGGEGFAGGNLLQRVPGSGSGSDEERGGDCPFSEIVARGGCGGGHHPNLWLNPSARLVERPAAGDALSKVVVEQHPARVGERALEVRRDESTIVVAALDAAGDLGDTCCSEEIVADALGGFLSDREIRLVVDDRLDDFFDLAGWELAHCRPPVLNTASSFWSLLLARCRVTATRI